MSIKKTIEDLLIKYPPLFKLGSKIYHRFNSSFLSLSPETPAALLKAFKIVADRKQEPTGDYYEFGLFRGFAFLKAYEHSHKLGLDKINFYGFDSFEGLPEAEGIDVADGRFFEGQFACSKESVEKNLMSNGMDMNRTALIKGFYEDSLTEDLRKQHDFKPASVVLMDCDLYSSTVEALTWVDNYLQDGTIILFDDWYSFGESEDLGQQKAMKEFLDARPNYQIKHLWNFCRHGSAYVLEVKS
jgi:hypothetical protein